jgi:hypothetical protein
LINFDCFCVSGKSFSGSSSPPRRARIRNAKNAGYIHTLAAAYAEAGDFRSAVELEQRTLQLDISSFEQDVFETSFAVFEAYSLP